eukprot:g42430.t1
MRHEGKELRGVVLKHFPTVDVALVSLDEKVPGMVGREGVIVGLDWLGDAELKKISVEELKMLEASKESLAKDAFGWKEKSPLMMLLRCGAHLECPKTILEKEKEKKKGSIVADPDEELPKGYFWLGVPFRQDPDVPEQAKIAFHENSKAQAKYAEISDASKPQGSDSDEDEEQEQKAKGKQERGSDSDDDEKPLVAPRKGKQENASRSEDDDGDWVPPSRKGNIKGKGRGKGKRKGKVKAKGKKDAKGKKEAGVMVCEVCDQPWADGEDCVNGCITINVVVIERINKLTTHANVLKSYPEELHCDYKDYRRDDESEVPMKELVNGRGEVLRTYLGKMFPKWRASIPLKGKGRSKFADGFYIGEKPPERSWYRHKDKSKHDVKGWVRLASFMPVATLLGPCEFAQDTMTLASREKVLQLDDATKPTRCVSRRRVLQHLV